MAEPLVNKEWWKQQKDKVGGTMVARKSWNKALTQEGQKVLQELQNFLHGEKPVSINTGPKERFRWNIVGLDKVDYLETMWSVGQNTTDRFLVAADRLRDLGYEIQVHIQYHTPNRRKVEKDVVWLIITVE